jgi:hypothetical protein
MKKVILSLLLLGTTLGAIAQTSSEETDRRRRGCREWYVTLFGWTILAHHSDECGNSDGNWDWGGNGQNAPFNP